MDEAVPSFLSLHGAQQTVGHVRAVAEKAALLARELGGVDPARAAAAGWLHDVSAVVPLSARLDLSRRLGLGVFPEEEAAPMLLHQRLSVSFAENCFAVDDLGVLSAIGCHTTLRAGASLLDRVVFLADKIAWDQTGLPPYLAELEAALRSSVETAVRVYLASLWERRDSLPALHPWFVDACREYGLVPR